jgi:hypothetical protein
VELSIERKGSVHPTLGNSIEQGMSPGADFFDDESSGSEWEDPDDDNRTQTFLEDGGIGLGIGSLVHCPVRQDRRSRGRSLERNGLTALPPLDRTFQRYSLQENSATVDNSEPKRARHVSLTWLEKSNVRVVHNHGSRASTPRGSITSNVSENTTSHFPETVKPYPIDMRGGAPALQEYTHGRHRRNTSDSILADSIINAHLTTMQALKAFSPSESIPEISGRSFHSATSAEPPKTRSFSNSRRIKLSPISVKDRDNLPSHFVKTPYPFTAKKEFPKPATRPRQHNSDGRLDSGYGEDSGYGGEGSSIGYSDVKGKQVLGLMSGGENNDLRSRLERNAEAQGIIRTQDSHDDIHSHKSVLHLSLQNHHEAVNRRQARIIIPNDLATTSSNTRYSVDFDDKYLAERLRSAHRELAGPWVQRCFSARKLRYICLRQSSAWSESHEPVALHGINANKLLASGAGSGLEDTTFTEDKLLHFFRHPKSGKARYTWVHWARRVAMAHLDSKPRLQSSGPSQPASYQESVDGKEGSVTHHTVSSPSGTIMTVQFVHTLSTLRILVAIILVLMTSAMGALLWIFLGVGSGWMRDLGLQSASRVGSGMAIGVLILLLELLMFGVWVWRS